MFSIHRFVLLLLLSWQMNAVSAQSKGCADPQATNYNEKALNNDGSCQYEKVTYTPQRLLKLSSQLDEISGMVYWNGRIVVLNDGGNGNKLYLLDTATGKIVQTVVLEGATNTDWEDLAQDSLHFYVGDAGNNVNGNRRDLVIYKIPKSAIGMQEEVVVPAASIQQIRFKYSDQVDFKKLKNNKTRFDCEAIAVLDGKVHLFTKNWAGEHSVHYTLPTQPGDYLAERKDSLYTGRFIITGAAVAGPSGLMLTGYTKGGRCALFLVYGFTNSAKIFTGANKRVIYIPTALNTGQLEAACFYNGGQGWLANERVDKKGVKVDAHLMRFSWFQWIDDFYRKKATLHGDKGQLRYNKFTGKMEAFDGTRWKSVDQQ
jgi:hypothetical protein